MANRVTYPLPVPTTSSPPGPNPPRGRSGRKWKKRGFGPLLVGRDMGVPDVWDKNLYDKFDDPAPKHGRFNRAPHYSTRVGMVEDPGVTLLVWDGGRPWGL